MVNEGLPPDPDQGLPRTTPFPTSVPGRGPSSQAPTSALVAAEAPGAVDRNGIFGELVKDDADIAGLVAYSIYKQNKLDWLRAFEDRTKRAPDTAELTAYIIGEGTARRLATYRHLAEATLAGHGPDVDGTGASRAPRKLAGADTKRLTNGLLLTYGLVAVLFVIILWFAARYTTLSR